MQQLSHIPVMCLACYTLIYTPAHAYAHAQTYKYMQARTHVHTLQGRQYSSSPHHTHMNTLGHAMYVLFYDSPHRQSVT